MNNNKDRETSVAPDKKVVTAPGRGKTKKSRFNKALIVYVEAMICVFIVLTLITLVVMVIKILSPRVNLNIDESLINDVEVNTNISSADEITDGQDTLQAPTAVPDEADGATGTKKIYLDFNTSPLPKAYQAIDDLYTTFTTDNPDYKNNPEKIVVIDPGHQSYEGSKSSDVWLSPYLDPSQSSSWVYNHLMKLGATGVSTGKSEYETTHAVAKKLKTELEARGYTVYLTKDDVSVAMQGAERAAVANKNDADLMISLHCDAYTGDSSVSGALALTPDYWNGYPDKNLVYLSYEAAMLILKNYTEATGLKSRGYTPITHSSAFSFCKVPTFLLEMGYLTNPSDDKLLNSTDFQSKMVTGIANGIDAYFAALTFKNK